jgi:hypothetical protein
MSVRRLEDMMEGLLARRKSPSPIGVRRSRPTASIATFLGTPKYVLLPMLTAHDSKQLRCRV